MLMHATYAATIFFTLFAAPSLSLADDSEPQTSVTGDSLQQDEDQQSPQLLAARPFPEEMEKKNPIQLEAGTTSYIEFPELGKTWKDKPARAGLYLPENYSLDKTFALLVVFGGGAGTDSPARAIKITGGRDFICLAVPYRTDTGKQPGGWQTDWDYYQTIFNRVESLVPNIDGNRRACAGFSSGGAAILHQIGNSNGRFQEYFQAFMPCAAGWPMGGLESIQGRPMLAIMGETDKRLPNFRKLEQAAKETEVDFELRILEGVGHKIPEQQHVEMRKWLVSKLNLSTRSALGDSFDKWDQDQSGGLTEAELPELYRADFHWADTDQDGSLSSDECQQYLSFHGRIVEGRKAIPADIRVIEDIIYVQGGHARQKLDLYLPAKGENSERLPLVVWVHGGGWKKGTKELFHGQPILLRNGFALASVNYRLTPHAPFPAQIHDCKAAIRFLRANANQYNLDPNRIGVWGSSAGGHLVALLGVSDNVRGLEGTIGTTGVSSQVQAVCDFFGPTNLFTQSQRTEPKGRAVKDSAQSTIAAFLGGPLNQKTELAELASPSFHVDADDAPFLIMHGDKDSLVPLQQSTSFRDLMIAAGGQCELQVVSGAGHAFFKDEKYLREVVRFFSEELK